MITFVKPVIKGPLLAYGATAAAPACCAGRAEGLRRSESSGPSFFN